MRKIKFRAWIGKERKMIQWEDVRCVTFDDIATRKCDWRCELLQYAGLKDKTRKEIYKGDICEDKLSKFTGLYSDTKKVRFSIEYSDGVFCVKYKTPVSCGTLNGDFSDCEIIGNIYETPELLNEESIS